MLNFLTSECLISFFLIKHVKNMKKNLLLVLKFELRSSYLYLEHVEKDFEAKDGTISHNQCQKER